jgi:hypothetical protein
MSDKTPIVAAAVQNERRESLGRATEAGKRTLLNRRLAWLQFMDDHDPPALTSAGGGQPQTDGVYVDVTPALRIARLEKEINSD